MYFNNTFPASYGVQPRLELANKPVLLLPENAREGKNVEEYARLGAEAVVAQLGLCRK